MALGRVAQCPESLGTELCRLSAEGLAPAHMSLLQWHAKCVIADDDLAFVTSANFTEWAQQRNVEAGVLIRDRHFAGQLRQQFDGLVQSRQVHRLPGF